MVVWSHPDNYGVPQFLEAIQNGQNLTAFGAPHITVCSGARSSPSQGGSHLQPVGIQGLQFVILLPGGSPQRGYNSIT